MDLETIHTKTVRAPCSVCESLPDAPHASARILLFRLIDPKAGKLWPRKDGKSGAKGDV